MDRVSILLSTQRALLGMVTKTMKAITVGYTDHSITLRVYFETEPFDMETELIMEITSEIAADFPNINEFFEECIVTSERYNKLECLDAWVYARYEGS